MRLRLWASRAAVVAFAGGAPQGCGSSTPSGPSDAAMPTDAPPLDSSSSAESGPGDSGPGCGTVAPHGMQLVASPSVSLDGVTGDGYVIYTDAAAMTVSAVPIGGGAPIPIGSVDATNSVFLSGNVVYFEPMTVAGQGGSGVGSLSTWTAAGGVESISTSVMAVPTGSAGTGNGFVAVSPDGTHILYVETPDGVTGTLTVATIDGRTKTSLLSGLDLATMGCQPYVAFAGPNAVAGYCIASMGSDAGSPFEGGVADAMTSDAMTSDAMASDAMASDAMPADAMPADAMPAEAGDASSGMGNTGMATIATFTGPMFAQRVLATNALATFVVDPSGAHVLVSGASGLTVYPSTGGTGTRIDPSGLAGVFTKDGANVVYTTGAGALRRSSVATPAPVTLTSGGLVGLLTLSPDERWALAYKSLGNMGNTYDLVLASARTQGAATTLSATSNSAIYGDAFTADSAYALYFTNVDVTKAVGDFYVARSSGGLQAKVTSAAWSVAATTGSKVLFNDNCPSCSSTSAGSADIRAVDATDLAAPTTLVSQASANFFVTMAKDKVVYAWTCMQDSSAGVYVIPVP
jgi:pentapeptide MXKDX repeat protein